MFLYVKSLKNAIEKPVFLRVFTYKTAIDRRMFAAVLCLLLWSEFFICKFGGFLYEKWLKKHHFSPQKLPILCKKRPKPSIFGSKFTILYVKTP
jgi:hypothetical protein